MAKKRVKVFESGSFPQGEFSEERTKRVFESAGEVPGIYIHSSKWQNKGKNPLELGKFNNFSFEKTGENLAVYADVELNEKGQLYHEDGVFNGISVEIDATKDSLGSIALLPLGVEPAVATAEFQEKKVVYTGKYKEFEVKGGEKVAVTKEEIKKALTEFSLGDRAEIINALVATVSDEERKGMRKLMEWAKIEAIQSTPEKELTTEELRKQIKEEMEFEAREKELIELSKKKVIPVLQQIVEFAIKKAGEERATIIEFSETEKISYFEKFQKDFEAMPDGANFESEVEKMEFGKEDEESKETTPEKRFAAYSKGV
ncbi:hypothetical protein [Fusobacterium ulcerans]|uniref:hypothetical protein n=1 Tax=Fusobacterium ulcerans TaxID=861 RepID=UPI003FED47CC